jgi:hypothetical protein
LPPLADLVTDLWERMQARGEGTLRVADRREIIQSVRRSAGVPIILWPNPFAPIKRRGLR